MALQLFHSLSESAKQVRLFGKNSSNIEETKLTLARQVICNKQKVL